MKSISRLILSLAIVAIAFTGCDEDDYTGQSTMIPTTPFPGITVSDLPVNVIMEERDTTMEFTFSMAQMQTVDVAIQISVDDASTATDGEDFELSATTVVIPAFTTTGGFEVSIFRDGVPEGDETVIINVGDNSTANAVFEARQMSMTLTNYSLEAMNIIIDWDGEFEFAGAVFPICGNVDIDPVAFADAAGTFSLSDDWGACPEQFSNVGDGLPTSSAIGGSNIVWGEDTYTFVSDLYSNALFGYGLGAVEYPITVTVERLGVTLPTSFMQRMDQWFNGDDAGYYEDGVGSQSLIFVLVIEPGNVYKFYDPVDDDLLLTTRQKNQILDAWRVKSQDYPGNDGELIN